MIHHYLSAEAVKLLSAIPPHVWFLLWISLYGLGTLILLWAMAQVKTLFGWPGVLVVLLAVTYLFAYTRGTLHQSINPFDNPQAAIVQVLK